MTGTTKALIEYLRKAELELDDDWLRQMVQQFTRGLIEPEVEQKSGAARHERPPNWTTQRNGYRERGLATRAGNLSCVFLNCARAASFPVCWNRAGVPRRRS